MQDRYTRIPLREIQKLPIKEGNYRLIRNNFWLLDENDNILIYGGYSPMCNPIEQIAKMGLKTNNVPAIKYQMVDYAWIDIDG